MISLEFETEVGDPVMGIDEAGRGPLAGGVYAAAVSVPLADAAQLLEGAWRRVNDSKKLSPRARDELAETIRNTPGCKWAVASASPAEIDDLNILRSNRYRVYTNMELTTPEELQQLLRDERRRELCVEGFRFFDLKRYGMPRIEHTLIGESGAAFLYVLEERDPSYCVPLPDNALEHNESLVQNPLANRRVGVQQ